ncbi:hypothetical protein Ddc_16654 [Ditylenchus destructor]|nr:hypothetical protein Ddc_16654 [Ditylenchus destructor]
MATGDIPAQIDFEHREKDKTDIYDDKISVKPLYDQQYLYYHTCCGKVHVEIAAIWIAILSFLFHYTATCPDSDCSFGRLVHIFASHYYLSIGQEYIIWLCFTFFGIASYVCILAAHKNHIARLYWPFLLYNGLMIAGVSITAEVKINYMFRDEFVRSSVPAFLVIAQLLLFVWMELIIYKAYKYTVNHGNGNNNRMMHFNNPMYCDDSMKV